MSELRKIEHLDPEDCQIWLESPRELRCVLKEELDFLTRSLYTRGQEHPVIARLNPDTTDDTPKYEVVLGTKRFLAASWLRKGNPAFRLKAIVTEISDRDAFVLSHRKGPNQLDLCAFERAGSIGYFSSMGYFDSAEDLAEQIGETRAFVECHLAIFHLPFECLQLFDLWPLVSEREAWQLVDAMSEDIDHFYTMVDHLKKQQSEGCYCFSKQELMLALTSNRASLSPNLPSDYDNLAFLG